MKKRQINNDVSNNILILNKTQFGYNTDYLKYCEYLKDEFKITYLCFDIGLKKIEIGSINIKYISNKGGKLVRGIRFYLTGIKYIFRFKGIIFINYFEYCQFFKWIFKRKKIILDIRTLSVSPKKSERTSYDRRMSKAISYFDHITVISIGVQKKLFLGDNNSSILPLGADIISNNKKNFCQLNLLYVGTLSGRKIEETIKGFSLFCDSHPEINDITYDIIGSGYGDEQNILRQYIVQHRLSDKIKLYGRIPYDELQPFFYKCNVGVSYVPMTEYYEYQPVTKTYEYILSGLVCIATCTFENKFIINSENGFLCNDNAESFANALDLLYKNRFEFNSDIIRNTLLNFTWENIVNEKLCPLLKSKI